MTKFSRMTLGTVQFGLNYGIANTGGKPSYEKAREITAYAYENGITSFDTAAGYGDSEKVLGRIFKELKIKDKVQVISKIPPLRERKLSQNEVEKRINESVETSLKRLGIEQLAVCLFHHEEDFEYIDILRGLEARGLAAGSGVSLDSANYCEQILAGNIKFLQVPYNILDKRFDPLWPLAETAGITLFCRSVYLQGLLLMPETSMTNAFRELIPVRRELEKTAAASGMDMRELCMRYVLGNPAVTSVLTGVDSREQLAQNIDLLKKGPLPEYLLAGIRKIVFDLPETIIRPALWPK
ncbi:MAG: aldo/keto reductase [Victivallaceae bacterium]|nr:aldo/keto reductase [Victivallaceae bacterium]